MKDTDYVYAVGRIRVNELSLLSSSDMGRLIAAKTYEEVVSQLNAKGYEINGTDYSSALNEQKRNTWKLLQEVLPDKSQMDSVIIKNDYHNLKAAVKSAVTGNDGKACLLSPSVYEPEKIYNAVTEKKFSDLPPEMRSVAEESYDILVRTHMAQLSDAVCDKAALEAMLSLAKKADSEIFTEIAECIVACTDIKILYRCILTGKSKEFMSQAVCSCKAFAADTLILKAMGGMDEFLSYLARTDYTEAAEALKQSPTAFEKYCDDRLMRIIEQGKRTAFGIEPLVAYYLAKEAELLSVRIVLSGKLNGNDEETIRERVRLLYV